MELEESKHQLNRSQTIDVQIFKNKKTISEIKPIVHLCQLIWYFLR